MDEEKTSANSEDEEEEEEETSQSLPEKLKTKVYELELAKLHTELVKLQQWVVHKGLKVCIIFEGRDGAGKGGVITAMTERVSPRIFRVVALPAPTERETTFRICPPLVRSSFSIAAGTIVRVSSVSLNSAR
jgi:polyphosphate kinase